jgi:multiple sugar transport system ATP-binding protein
MIVSLLAASWGRVVGHFVSFKEMHMASLELHGVIKNFAQQRILKGINFKIRDGEFLSLVGPSGCGKSTLLRMIAGLDTITEGEIEIGGTVVNGLAAKDRDIAMVFQNYALYPHMTVRENMAFALEMRGESRATIDERVHEASRILGLEHLLARLPRQLSGGQQQRVAMGRAIVRQPKVFLFDEPLSNLDAQLRVQMRTEIKDLHARLGVTTIYVTHDQIEAMTMADRIVLMRQGLVEQIGPPLELYDRPNNTFVATFIGSPSMNLLDGEIVCDEVTRFKFADGQVLDISCYGAQAKAGPVRLGIRPEHIGIDGNGVKAKALVVEPTGSETHVTVDVAGQRLGLIVKDRVSISRGEEIGLSMPVSRCHLFDAGTQARIDRQPIH